MLKAITFILLAMLITVNVWSEENNYLEGISILGNKKVAYLSIAGNTIAVKEGEEIVVSEDVVTGRWQVVRIEQGLIRLKTKIGIITELRLDTRLPVQKTDELGNKIPPIDETIKTPVTDTNETVPSPKKFPDHKLVQTPFGSFTVKKNMSLAPSKPVKLPLIVEDKIPTGHRLVRTPFGYFIVKTPEPNDK